MDTEKLTYYFFNDTINIKDSDSRLLKIDKKSYKNIDITKLYTLQLKRLMIMKMSIVQILCI